MKYTKPCDHDFNVHAQTHALIGTPYLLCAGMVAAAHGLLPTRGQAAARRATTTWHAWLGLLSAGRRGDDGSQY
jgi:hypothetical protein